MFDKIQSDKITVKRIFIKYLFKSDEISSLIEITDILLRDLKN
jgi:hypothetical protein